MKNASLRRVIWATILFVSWAGFTGPVWADNHKVLKMKPIDWNKKIAKLPPEALQDKQDLCKEYAVAAVDQHQANLQVKCGFWDAAANYNGAVWNADYDYHYQWCLNAKDFDLARSEYEKRNTALKECADGQLTVDLVLEKHQAKNSPFPDKATILMSITNKGPDPIPAILLSHIQINVDFFNSQAGNGICTVNLALLKSDEWASGQQIFFTPATDAMAPCPQALCDQYQPPGGGLAFVGCATAAFSTGKAQIVYPQQIPDITGGPFYHLDEDLSNNVIWFKESK